jgi:hypothetical protein
MLTTASVQAAHVGPASIYPDPTKTPGATNPVLTQELICSKTFRTGPYRKVNDSLKKKVFEEYGIPWADRSKYEVDHFESLELGGANDIKNLWPEPYQPIPGAKQKDVVEDYLHKEMCEGRITQAQALEKITTDWYAVYVELKGGMHQ